jgi:galactose mutarotase-like enzyme
MFEVTTRTAPIPTYVLRDTESGAEVEVCPSRGGLITRFKVGDTPVLSMDDTTLYDLSKNVRGGVPILFPMAGPLKDNQVVFDGKTYEMKQHGFARNEAWKIVRHSTEGSAQLTISLRSSEETRARFPFDFLVQYTYELKGSSLTLHQSYQNLSSEPMPLHAGFHPYFHVPDAEKASTKVDTQATKAFDNVTKKDFDFTGFDLTQKEVDLHLHDHGSTKSFIQRPNSDKKIEVVASSEFTHWVVWTLAGKDFICLEPWTAPGNALNTKQRLIMLAPNEAKQLWTEIALR